MINVKLSDIVKTRNHTIVEHVSPKYLKIRVGKDYRVTAADCTLKAAHSDSINLLVKREAKWHKDHIHTVFLDGADKLGIASEIITDAIAPELNSIVEKIVSTES